MVGMTAGDDDPGAFGSEQRRWRADAADAPAP